MPLFQFYPRAVQVALVRRFKLGWMPRQPVYADARREVEQIRLLSRSEMRGLFPDASVYRERFAGMTKSLVAYGGWNARLTHAGRAIQ